MSPDIQSALDQAVAALGAVEVAPERYAFKRGDNRYDVATQQCMNAATFGTYGCTVGSILMPAWWTPEQRFIVRGDGGYIYALCPSKEGATAGLSGSHGTMRVFTANLETGEEVAA